MVQLRKASKRNLVQKICYPLRYGEIMFWAIYSVIDPFSSFSSTFSFALSLPLDNSFSLFAIGWGDI